jgi:hypothetical protein
VQGVNVNRSRRSAARITFTVLTGSLISCAAAMVPVGSITVASAQSAPASICAINSFSISGNQSDGGAGSYNTYIYLTNSGPTCRLVPIGARGYDDVTHSFVGSTATVAKPIFTSNQVFPYATRKLLGTVEYGQSISLLLSYADVGLGGLRDCGKVATANSVAFWMTARPHLIKVAHLVFGQRGAFKTLQTCSNAKYLGVWWPSTGPFWFAS